MRSCLRRRRSRGWTMQTLAPTPPAPFRNVLLLLNVQVGLVLDPASAIPNASPVRENIARVLAAARRAAEHKPHIIHVRNCGEAGEPDEEGKPSWNLVLTPLAGEDVVDKKKSNAFSGTPLDEMIHPDAEIVVVGLMTEYSVKSTCKAAMARGNTVILMHGAHGTYDHVELANNGLVTRADKIVAQIEEELDIAGAMVLDMDLLPGVFDGR
ncbi:Isochorismatase domain-containing protein [Mycena kentingensis (nom. inval.)]|nr:Isochorismatase domain-containing protein [Mycena kentingensis (nom. inval.)]